MQLNEELIRKQFYLRYGSKSNEVIALNLGVNKKTVIKWFKEEKIPLLRMYQIHYLLVN